MFTIILTRRLLLFNLSNLLLHIVAYSRVEFGVHIILIRFLSWKYLVKAIYRQNSLRLPYWSGKFERLVLHDSLLKVVNTFLQVKVFTPHRLRQLLDVSLQFNFALCTFEETLSVQNDLLIPSIESLT